MFIGVIYITLACAFWAIVFVIPEFLRGFHALEISLGRFLVYGSLSFLLLVFKGRHLFSFQYLTYWRKALFLAFISTVISYTGTVYNIQFSGPATATLVFAMAPICISIVGNWKSKDAPFQRLLLPLCLMFLGIFLAKFKGSATYSHTLSSYITGIFLGLIGLGCWTWFIVDNSMSLEKNTRISPTLWTLMIGTGALVFSLILSLFALGIPEVQERFFIPSKELKEYVLGVFLLGFLGTGVSLFFWNLGAKRLPITLLGQLASLEIAFALLYIYLIEKRWPSMAEAAGILFMLGGIVLGFKLFKRPKGPKDIM